MKTKEIEVNSRVFVKTSYLDIEVLVDKETGYYYAQKICDDNGKRLEHLLENNDYKLMKQAVTSTTGIPVVDLEITFPGMPVGYRSKCVHPLLVNYIAEWANKAYAVKVAQLMNVLTERLKLENRTLHDEIESEKRLVDDLKSDNDSLMKKVNQLHKDNELLHKDNEDLKAMIEDLTNMNIEAKQEVSLMRRELEI